MTDFKLGDSIMQVIEYGNEVVATTAGLHFIDAPDDADLAEIKVWGAGGGGGGRGENGLAKGGDGGGGGFRWAQQVPVIPGEGLVLVVGGGGSGGLGYTGVGESGDGGAGAGRSYAAKFPVIQDVLCESGGGAGGGGVGAEALNSSEFGGAGGPGGGDVGGDGTVASGPWGAPAEFGDGGTQVAGGDGGGFGGGSGEDGTALNGGNGHRFSGDGDGDQADGGQAGGGDGGAYESDGGGGGGGGAGKFGGGGGASGSDSEFELSEPGAGGGGGSGQQVPTAVLVASEQGIGSVGAGKTDVDYPGAFVGDGGLGGLAVDNGAVGSNGAVIIRFGTLRTVTTTNDIVIENDAPVLVEGVDLIAQHVRTILLICQGEWFLDLAAGTPWFQRIIGHKFNAGQINITVRDAILSVDGVASIVDIVSVRGAQPRSADIKVKVLTTQGAEVIIEAEVP